MREWAGMRSEYNLLPATGETTVTKPHQVGISFSEHNRVVHEVDGRASYLTYPAGAVFVNGPHEVRWTDVTEPTEALEIYPDLSRLPEELELSGPGVVELDLVTAGRDTTMLSLAWLLKRAHVGGTEPDDMQASMLSHLLLTHVAENYCRSPLRNPRGSGRLARSVVDRIGEFVDERVGQPLVLDDLAREARLSPYHFARAFKRSTGLAPHEFVTMRRMERAKALLLAARGSVSEVAYQVGYSNVGHFRRLFRRHLGVLPSDVRS